MQGEYPEIPEFIRKLMEAGERIDEIRIDGEGRWLHDGVPFENERIISFFNRSIDVTEQGEYVIHYADFVYPLIVDDVPVFVTGIRFDGSGDSEAAYITLTTGEEEELDPDTLYLKSDCLYCYVREGRLPAKFRRSPSFQILERLEESEDTYSLRIGGRRIVLREKVE